MAPVSKPAVAVIILNVDPGNVPEILRLKSGWSGLLKIANFIRIK